MPVYLSHKGHSALQCLLKDVCHRASKQLFHPSTTGLTIINSIWPCVSVPHFFRLSAHLLFVLWHCCAGNCGKTHFSCMHCGGWSLQKINGWLVFLTFAQWSLSHLNFCLHNWLFVVIFQAVISSFYSSWSCNFIFVSTVHFCCLHKYARVSFYQTLFASKCTSFKVFCVIWTSWICYIVISWTAVNWSPVLCKQLKKIVTIFWVRDFSLFSFLKLPALLWAGKTWHAFLVLN